MKVPLSSKTRAMKRATSANMPKRRSVLRLLPAAVLLSGLTALLGYGAPAAQAQTVAWTQIYDYHSDDEIGPAKIARDNAGNIIVANTSAYNSVEDNYDWTVSKYSAAGTKLWTGTFDSPNTGSIATSKRDEVVALAVDSANNIYVTGSTVQGNDAEGEEVDWATVKFSGSTGSRLWVKKYGGERVDAPAAIALDSAQNVYVTGTYTDTFTVGGSTFLHTDIVLIKYDPSGNIVFIKSFDSPDAGLGAGQNYDYSAGLIVDASNNATVFGRTYQGTTRKYDGLVLRYNSVGTLIWKSVYNGVKSGDDSFVAGARDSAGNVYAAGKTYIGNGDDDALLVKYAPTGGQSWVRTVDGRGFGGTILTSGLDFAAKVVVDGSNNIYLAGDISVSTAFDDAFLLKYNAAGAELWRRQYDNQLREEDVNALTLDNLGNVYVGVSAQIPEDSASYDNFNWKILKYSTSGALLSELEHERLGRNDRLGDIVIDNTVPTRDIYAVGTVQNLAATKSYDLAVRKWTQTAIDPTLAPFDMSVGQDNKVRILWNRLNAPGITLWTVNLAGTPDNGKAYSMPVGWTPVSQTMGGNQQMRFLLKEEATGRVAVWTFSADILTLESGVYYGPVGGYVAKDIAVSPNGKMRLIWEETASKRIAFWTIPASGVGIESGIYVNPPAAGYTFRKLSMGSDNVARLLWMNGAAACLTTLNATNAGVANNTIYTLGGGFSPLDLSVGNDNMARILWSDSNGSVKISRYAVAGSVADGPAIALGPYAGLTPVSLWYGKGDGKGRIMWRYDDGRMVLMRLNSAGVIEQQNTYGPY